MPGGGFYFAKFDYLLQTVYNKSMHDLFGLVKPNHQRATVVFFGACCLDNVYFVLRPAW